MTAEQFLELAAELPEAMLLLRGDGRIVAANHSGGRCFGQPHQSLVGTSLQDLVSDGEERVQESLRLWSRTRSLVATGLTVTCGKEGTGYRAEGLLLKPRTETQPALILLRLIPREHSSQQFVLLNHRLQELSREIHLRRRAEEELRAQREWLHVTLTSIGDAVIATDAQGQVSLMNPIAETLTGWRLEEAEGRCLTDVFHIVHEESRTIAENPVAEVLRKGVVVGLANHTVLIARDGTERPIDDSAAPIRGPDGQLRGVVLVFHDVSDRRTLERQLKQRAAELEEADRRKDDFLAVLAHELRNPLAPIRTAAQVLLMNGSERETVNQVAETVKRQSEHLATLVDDLLDVSRITRGKISLRSDRVDLTEVVQRSVRDFGGRCQEAGIEFHAALPPKPLWVQGDRTRLTQVVDNLLDNGCKFTQPGGSVTVRLNADAERNQAVLAIVDDGIGLDPEMIQRLFVPFAQADRTLDRSKGGLGLGLALVKGLLDLHGGEVRAASAGVGRGAEFVVRLPLLEPSAAETETAQDIPPAKKGLRILLVEDNADAAAMMAMLVRLIGHQVSIAKTGDEGIEMALRDPPDVVLCDIGLPGKNGHEVATYLRQRPEFRKTRLIALSGYGQAKDKTQARQAGFDSHLTKPVDPNRLRDELDAVQGGVGPK